MAASELLALALNVLPGTYPTAYWHARRAVALAPRDISYKEHLLSFHNNPDRLMSDEEARRVAQEVLGDDVANAAATQVLNSLHS